MTDAPGNLLNAPGHLLAEEFLRWSREDYEEAILTIVSIWEAGHGAYVEFADEDGPTQMSLIFVAALRVAALLARPNAKGETDADQDGAAEGVAANWVDEA